VAEDAPYEKLPILSKKDLPSDWQASIPSFCVARSPIDDAAAIMLGQLSTSHGIAARVEAAEVLSIANVFQLETTGVAIVCLIYMDQTAQLTRVTPFDVLAVNCRRLKLFWVAG
jgi:hypothetical protein